jgi:two-component system alkaline phosphatase synthesis response regulator PhoP
MSDKKILVIDDDEFIQGLLSISLREEGYDVTCADDGQIGFNKAVTEDFDLIITDIKMPNWSGAESIYGLNLVNNTTKIIVVSGYIEDELREELESYDNVIKIFPKPFDALGLLEFVRLTLNT